MERLLALASSVRIREAEPPTNASTHQLVPCLSLVVGDQDLAAPGAVDGPGVTAGVLGGAAHLPQAGGQLVGVQAPGVPGVGGPTGQAVRAAAGPADPDRWGGLAGQRPANGVDGPHQLGGPLGRIAVVADAEGLVLGAVAGVAH